MGRQFLGFFSALLWAGMAVAQTRGMNTDIPVLVCRAKQCAVAEKSMTTAFLFNKLVNMLDSNMGADILVCNADPISHVCLENYITLPATAGIASTQLSLPALRLLDAKLMKGKLGLNALLSYYFFIDGRTVPCQNALTKIVVASQNHVQMYSDGFACQATQTGNATLNAWFLVDYLDFDYGIIGAYYSIGSSQILRAEKTGYTLLRFTKAQTSTVNEINLTPRNQTGGSAVLPTDFLRTPAPSMQTQQRPVSGTGQGQEGMSSAPSAPALVAVTPDGQVVPKPQQDAYQRYKQAQEQAAALKAAQEKALEEQTKGPSETVPEQEKATVPETESTTEDQSAWQITPQQND